jgi:hypothetical protein
VSNRTFLWLAWRLLLLVLADGIFLLYVKVWYSLWHRRMFSGFRSVWIRLRSWRTASS